MLDKLTFEKRTYSPYSYWTQTSKLGIRHFKEEQWNTTKDQKQKIWNEKGS